jgi:hypothetical protein
MRWAGVSGTFIELYPIKTLEETRVKILKCVAVGAAGVTFLFGCGGQANINTATGNQNITVTNINKVEPTPLPSIAPPAAGFSLATPTDAYRTAHALREKKDLAGMKRVLSKDVIEFFTMIAEEEKKTVDDEIAQMFEKPQAKTAESRNETIKGDKASIEYLDEKGEWKVMDFVKEGQDWKLSLPSKDSPEPAAPGKKSP